MDEFLDIYTPMELERVERNDPIKKFSEKVAVQKTLTYHSPVRSPRNTNEGNEDKKNRLGSPNNRVGSPNTRVPVKTEKTKSSVTNFDQ